MVDSPSGSGSRADKRRGTEARIRDAASRLFVRSGYERTTIRAVASAAGVDPGLVIHYFGSKQELFRRVSAADSAPELSGTWEEVVDQILSRLAATMDDEPAHSLALLRSMLTHPDAAAVATRDFARFRDQVARSIGGDDAKLRAELVSAIVLGVVVTRHLLESDGYDDLRPDQVTDLLRPCLTSLAKAK